MKLSAGSATARLDQTDKKPAAKGEMTFVRSIAIRLQRRPRQPVRSRKTTIGLHHPAGFERPCDFGSSGAPSFEEHGGLVKSMQAMHERMVAAEDLERHLNADGRELRGA